MTLGNVNIIFQGYLKVYLDCSGTEIKAEFLAEPCPHLNDSGRFSFLSVILISGLGRELGCPLLLKYFLCR